MFNYIRNYARQGGGIMAGTLQMGKMELAKELKTFCRGRCGQLMTFTVTECESSKDGRWCIVIAVCQKCGAGIKNVRVPKRVLSCFDKTKHSCPKWHQQRQQEEDTAPKKGEGKKIGFFARLFGR